MTPDGNLKTTLPTLPLTKEMRQGSPVVRSPAFLLLQPQCEQGGGARAGALRGGRHCGTPSLEPALLQEGHQVPTHSQPGTATKSVPGYEDEELRGLYLVWKSLYVLDGPGPTPRQ
jgi:hypothetical protein